MITIANGFTADDEYKRQLNELTTEVFEFSFDMWQDRGFWDADFECHSIIESGVMLANVSVYKLNLLINGRHLDYIQISTVATREECRGMGLSRRLMENVFDMYPGTPAFLMGGDSVIDFYPKFGFVNIHDKQPYIECRLQGGREMRRLDVTDPRIDMYLRNRSQYSGIFDCTNRYSINWFHLLYRYSKRIYEIPELGALLVARQDENVLTILDIAATKPIDFTALVPHLGFNGVDTVRFCFNPDWLGIHYKTADHLLEDSNLFVKGSFDVDKDFIVPYLIIA